MRTLILLAVVALSTAAAAAQAPTWTADQQAVWQTVQAYNNAIATKDAEGFLRHLHPRYSAWYYDNAHPTDAATDRDVLPAWFGGDWRSAAHSAHPMRIEVVGDVAVVHYTFSMMTVSSENRLHDENERWTDTLVRENGRWLVLATHGGDIDALGGDD